MPQFTPQLLHCQKSPQSIRNFCILAHVDHGKTTLSDSLLASNGIISAKMSGKIRYMDSRPDEQERGITMKSSGISLYFNVIKNIHQSSETENPIKTLNQEYLMNLIDSPGHIDFSSEVSAASRLCDGALILIDSVEGVCSQTVAVLRQAWEEGLKPILVFNKMDRLILELTLTPNEAYNHITKILEQVNAIMSTLFSEDILAQDAIKYQQRIVSKDSDEWILEEQDDSGLFFSPECGNVVFASSVDGWAFRTSTFASIYASKLGMKESLLRKALWGDYYFDTKTKRVIGAAKGKEKGLKCMFVQFILENIWHAYRTVSLGEKESILKIIKSLQLKINPRDIKLKDPKWTIQSIMSQWLPLSTVILLSVAEIIPSPLEAQSKKFKTMFDKTNELLKNAVMNCKSSSEDPVVIYVSKMFSVDAESLPGKKRVQLTAEQMRERRAMIIKEKGENNASESSTTEITPQPAQLEETDMMVGFARIYSGTIKVGQEIYVLHPKYNPDFPDIQCSKAVVKRLFLMMGRDMEDLEQVPAGNVFGISGLEDVILKSGTLSSTKACPSLGQLEHNNVAIVRVAVEAICPTQMNQLEIGLKLLNQADPSVKVVLQETGEHVIVCAGELHLERCIRDLRERYAKIEIQVSAPIVPFRETISNSPSISFLKSNKQSLVGTVKIETSFCDLRIRAVPLSPRVKKFLISSDIRDMVDCESTKQLASFMRDLELEWAQDFEDNNVYDKQIFESWEDRLWAFGPKGVGANMLFFDKPKKMKWIEEVKSKFLEGSMSKKDETLSDNIEKLEISNESIRNRKAIENSIHAGFQLATLSGPLCEEPMAGVAFILEEISIKNEEESLEVGTWGSRSGQLISNVRDACRQAFSEWSARLMLATYTCNLQAPSEVLGKVYAVLSKRRGKILSEEMRDGTPFFEIKSTLPVIESFGFSDEIRKRTSGAASPLLIFGGYEELDEDPYWVPTTDEELEDLGEKADRENVAKRYMEKVRERKGLLVEKRIIEHADKQKTLKNK